MRALRYEGPEKGVALARGAPEPALREGEALIRPLRIGISSADAAIATTRPDITPITLGHEFVGIVEKVNESDGSAPRFGALIGKRVVGSTAIVCGRCDLCRSGLSSHCASRAVLGVWGHDGCMAERFTLPLANLVVVPPGVDDDRAVFAEPLAAALHAVQQLRIEGKPYITVLGDGPVGLLCAQIMTKLNASVRVVGKHESKLELCAKWGIKHRLERDVGRRADQDVVVDCTGAPDGLELALRLVRPRGKVLVKGAIHASIAVKRPADVSIVGVNEIEIIGSRCGSIAEAISVLHRGEIDPSSLISKRIRLDDAVQGLALAARGDLLKIVIEP